MFIFKVFGFYLSFCEALTIHMYAQRKISVLQIAIHAPKRTKHFHFEHYTGAFLSYPILNYPKLHTRYLIKLQSGLL